MTLPVSFKSLTETDCASALRLSSLAGWNQTHEDWRRLVCLPDVTVGAWKDGGETRATFSVAPHGNAVCWIGMILADPEYRGRGLGTAAFAAGSGNTPVVCDILEETPCAAEIVAGRGLTRARALKRMTFPRASRVLSASGAWCGAGFEWG